MSYDTFLILKATYGARPLTEKYIALENLSILYCLLSNRLQFLHDAANLPNARLNASRAALCELLAIRLITNYAKPTALDTQPVPNPASQSALAHSYGTTLSLIHI